MAQNDFLVYHGFFDSLQVVPVHFATNDVDEFLVALKLHVAYLYLVHLVYDALVVGSQHLCAVVPVGFVAVIFAGVVRSGDVDSGLAAQLTDGKRNLRCGSEALEEVHFDAVGREDVSH